MVTAGECLIKADNQTAAAMLVGAEDGRALLRLAAIWRNRALRMKLDRHFNRICNDQGVDEMAQH